MREIQTHRLWAAYMFHPLSTSQCFESDMLLFSVSVLFASVTLIHYQIYSLLRLTAIFTLQSTPYKGSLMLCHNKQAVVIFHLFFPAFCSHTRSLQIVLQWWYTTEDIFVYNSWVKSQDSALMCHWKNHRAVPLWKLLSVVGRALSSSSITRPTMLLTPSATGVFATGFCIEITMLPRWAIIVMISTCYLVAFKVNSASWLPLRFYHCRQQFRPASGTKWNDWVTLRNTLMASSLLSSAAVKWWAKTRNFLLFRWLR